MPVKFGQQLLGVAKTKRENEPPFGQFQAMESGYQGWPVPMKLRRNRRQLRPGAMYAHQIVKPEGMLFNRHEVQFGTAQRVVQPLQPGRKKIETKAEAGFKYDESPPVPPARGEVVAGEKDVTRLAQTAGCRMIDVAEGLGIRYAIGVKTQARRFERKHTGSSKIKGK